MRISPTGTAYFTDQMFTGKGNSYFRR